MPEYQQTLITKGNIFIELIIFGFLGLVVGAVIGFVYTKSQNKNLSDLPDSFWWFFLISGNFIWLLMTRVL